MRPTLEHYLVVAALMFALGLLTVVARRGLVGLLLGVALALNAAALNFVAFDRFVAASRAPSGQRFAVFIVAVAACEVVVALAIAFRIRSERGAADHRDEVRR